MKAHECYHCRQWVGKDEPHDCWTTTETALTRELSEDLREAWLRIRETALEFGEQRIYASHSSIMFSRAVCYFFVRPKTRYLEVCVFLGRTVIAPQVRKATPSSRTKVAHLVRVTHRDEVEPPLSEWLREAYETSPTLTRTGARSRKAAAGKATTKAVVKNVVPKGSAGKGRATKTGASARVTRGQDTRRRRTSRR
jgi:hypothetical protein